jgi:hypothetical protein
MLRTIATQDELTVKARCEQVAGDANLDLTARTSTSTTASLAWVASNPATTISSAEFTDLAGDFEFFTETSTTSGLAQSELRVLYRNGSRVISLDIHAAAIDALNKCVVYGTAVPAS